MIDARYVPITQKITVPLYVPWDEDALHLRPNHLDAWVNSKDILWARSGTDALIACLTETVPDQKRVALPAFFCSKSAYQLLQHNFQLFFFDLGPDCTVSEEIIPFLKENKIQIVLWPFFFGARDLDQELVVSLLDQGLTVVIDYAQVFPYVPLVSYEHPNLYTLVSFGQNKPVNHGQGGAILSHGRSIPTRLKRQPEGASSESGVQKRHFSCLKERTLFDLETWRQAPQQTYGLDSLEQQKITDKIACFDSRQRGLQNRWQQLKRNLPVSSLRYIETVSHLSILALCFDNRYKVGLALARHGIQTTWYYYPLPLLEPFASCFSAAFPHTLKAAQTILILPWSVSHTNEQLDFLSETLSQVCHENY